MELGLKKQKGVRREKPEIKRNQEVVACGSETLVKRFIMQSVRQRVEREMNEPRLSVRGKKVERERGPLCDHHFHAHSFPRLLLFFSSHFLYIFFLMLKVGNHFIFYTQNLIFYGVTFYFIRIDIEILLLTFSIILLEFFFFIILLEFFIFFKIKTF